MKTLLISLYPPNKYGGKIGGVVILLHDILSVATKNVDLVVYNDDKGDFDLPEKVRFVPWNKIVDRKNNRRIKSFRYSLYKDYRDYTLDVRGYDKIIFYPYFSSLFNFKNLNAEIYTIGMDSGPLLYMRGMLNNHILKYKVFSLVEFIQAIKIDRHAVSLSKKVFTVGEADAWFYKSVLFADANFVHHPVSSLIDGYKKHEWKENEKLRICFPGGMTLFYAPRLMEDILTLILKKSDEFKGKVIISFLGRIQSKKVDNILSTLQKVGVEVERTLFAEDFEEYISSQDIVLLPLEVGVGTKNKALTTLGMGVDLIGTKIALENVYGVTEDHLACDATQFIAQINKRISNSKLYGLNESEIIRFKEYHSVQQWKENFWDVIYDETGI